LSSVFTKIINGELPCHKIAETNNCVAFLDINPNTVGHTLCIPKKEVDLIFDLDPKLYNELLSFSREIAVALKKAIPCKRISLNIIGLEVPHAHVHLIPINTMKDLDFSNKIEISESSLKEISSKIKGFVEL
tara:strand:+ start:337 stop:732 length:396 start_codon:yes stop_codon:yes gene_type:complete